MECQILHGFIEFVQKFFFIHIPAFCCFFFFFFFFFWESSGFSRNKFKENLYHVHNTKVTLSPTLESSLTLSPASGFSCISLASVLLLTLTLRKNISRNGSYFNNVRIVIKNNYNLWWSKLSTYSEREDSRTQKGKDHQFPTNHED